jgi:hypothetical protein
LERDFHGLTKVEPMFPVTSGSQTQKRLILQHGAFGASFASIRTAGATSARAAGARIFVHHWELLPALFLGGRAMQLDFSDELKVVADAWTWSRDPQTQVHFIRQCFRNGLWVEWWQTADGWELRIRRPE